MSNTRFTKDHEWVRLEGSVAMIGITEHAQDQLGDVVFVELPDIGRDVRSGEACAVVESVKAASDIYAPVSGRVSEVNEALLEDPATVNRDAMGDGWFFKLEVEDPGEIDELMDDRAYADFVEAL
jgi:glycine cleavage system H protein